MLPPSLTITDAVPRRFLRAASGVESFEGHFDGLPVRFHRHVEPVANSARVVRRLVHREALAEPGFLKVLAWSEDDDGPPWMVVERPEGLELAEWFEACATSPRFSDASLAVHTIRTLARMLAELMQRGLDLPGRLVADAWLLEDQSVWLGTCEALDDEPMPSEPHQARHLLELLRHLAGPQRPRALDLLAIEVGEQPTLSRLAEGLGALVKRLPELALKEEAAEPLRSAVHARRPPPRGSVDEEPTPPAFEATQPIRYATRAPDIPRLELGVEDTLSNLEVGGRYRLLRPIGSGAMGHVYEAERLEDGGKVAVKVMRPEAEGRNVKEYVSRFRREAQLLARLDHPNIVKVESFGTRGGCWIAMELVQGHSLVELLDSGEPLPLDLALSITKQVAEALVHAHTRGIVHRDIKPGNLLVAGHAPVHIKLCDFGLAKAWDDDEQTVRGALIGTPQYMSPEQARGEPAWARADLYGTGILLYRLVTGHTPFADHPAAAVLVAHTTTDPLPMAEANPRVEVPAIVQEVVDRCLAKDVDERYGDAEYLVHDLERCLERIASPHDPTPALTFNYREPTTEEPTGSVRFVAPSEPPPRLAWAAYGAAVALGIALVSGGLLAWWWSAPAADPPLAPSTPASE